MNGAVKSFVILSLLFVLVCPIFAQEKSDSLKSNNSVNAKEKKQVLKVIREFNRELFIKRDILTAIDRTFYKKKEDAIDKEYGFSFDFFRITGDVPKEKKLGHFAMNLYFYEWFHLLTWRLGKPIGSEDSKFEPYSFEDDPRDVKLIKTYVRLLGENGIAIDELESGKELPEDLDFYLKHYGVWQKALEKELDVEVVRESLETLQKRTVISKKTIKGRDYFLAENQIFFFWLRSDERELKIFRLRLRA